MSTVYTIRYNPCHRWHDLYMSVCFCVLFLALSRAYQWVQGLSVLFTAVPVARSWPGRGGCGGGDGAYKVLSAFFMCAKGGHQNLCVAYNVKTKGHAPMGVADPPHLSLYSENQGNCLVVSSQIAEIQQVTSGSVRVHMVGAS